MWKYNKYQVGEIVEHNDNTVLEFQICEILCGVPEKPSEYLYCCKLINGSNYEVGKILKYHENDLSFVRKGTINELSDLLKAAVHNENYELAEAIQHQMKTL